MTDHQPNDLEDRVRDAYQFAARTVQTLQRTSPVLAAGSVRRPRRMNALTPLAAAAAVIVVIAASVALPRLLAGSARNPAAPQVSAPWHYPPFQLVETNPNNSDARLQVESAATGHVVTTVAPPRPGATWGAITAVGDTGRFIVAADPKPSSSSSYPTRLYTLTLSARGTVAGLTPLGVPVLQGWVSSLAASADGRTVAYTLVPQDGRGSLLGSADRAVGVITDRTKRQWSIGGITGTGAGTQLIFDVSVSSDGSMVAFITQDLGVGVGYSAWVLPTKSAPGGITAEARKVYQGKRTFEDPGNKVAWLDSALISPDGFYRTLGEVLMPAGGGMLLAWNQHVSTAYLINPATRTRTTLQLHGVPPVGFIAHPDLLNVLLAW